MEIGLSTYLFVNQRLTSHILDQIHDAGIRQIEIYAARQHLDYRDVHHVRDVAQWFADHSVSLHSVHAPLFTDFDWGRSGGLAISPSYTEKRLRIDSMDEIKRAIEIAERLPFRCLICHMGLADEEYDLRKFDAAFTSLEHLKIFAKERGVQVLLENNLDHLSTPERLTQFIQYTRLEVKVCFDAGHAHLTGGVQPAFETLKPYSATFHLHDNHGEKDDHLMPFAGKIDWPAAIKVFAGSEGPIISLIEPRGDGTEPVKISQIQETIRRIDDLCRSDAERESQ
ncbi:MAG TPA: sugar phosphate isomerase/epimerase family protein [Terriglobia bacterium]|nr:sugar phosphate isomerase/epimerase family protein [Terriglobia bacterium]